MTTTTTGNISSVSGLPHWEIVPADIPGAIVEIKAATRARVAQSGRTVEDVVTEIEEYLEVAPVGDEQGGGNVISERGLRGQLAEQVPAQRPQRDRLARAPSLGGWCQTGWPTARHPGTHWASLPSSSVEHRYDLLRRLAQHAPGRLLATATV